MMQDWFSPSTFAEWAKRRFSYLNLILLGLGVALVASELRLDWAEALAGRYLCATNVNRPEKGGIWETGRHAANATQLLSRIIDQKQEALKAARGAESFSSLAKELGPGQWVILEKNHFRELFIDLPQAIRDTLVDPVRLVWLLNTDVVDRIFCEGQLGGFKVYFIDSDNRVIHQVGFDENLLVPREEVAQDHVRLDDTDRFSGRIYGADRFFQALFNLPEEMVPDLVGNAQALLREEGTLTRVGIGDTVENGHIPLGFEFVLLDEVRVVQIQAREWAVWQLGLVLKGETR